MKKETFILCLILININAVTIDSETRHFVDSEGRTTVLHGVNIVYKLPPYMPKTDSFDPLFSLSKEDLDYFKKFGFNLVRLGVTWESVEKTEGQYDMEHLSQMEKIINILGENGISVILDAHQDMFSRNFCGEGVPHFHAKKLSHNKECDDTYLSWMLKAFGACIPLSHWNWRYNDEGLPLIEDCNNFLKYHQSPELTTIYNSFYENEHGVQDKFIDFWKVMATKFKDNKYIIGFDIWNEPWPGNMWSTFYGLWPGYATDTQVLPFFKKVDKALREIKEDFVFLFETAPFPDTVPFWGGRVVAELRDTAAHDKKYTNKQVLNVHNYCCAARADVCDHGEPQLSDSDFCNDFHRRKIKSHLRNARDLGIPLIITEFGACSDSEACYHEMKNFVEHAEEDFVSWAYWMYKPYGDHTTSAHKETEGMFYPDGRIQDVKQKALTRTYIQKYQGIPVSNKFYPETGAYIASFLYNNEIKAPTVIYYNKDYFYKSSHIFRLFDENNNDIKFLLQGESDESNYINFTITDTNFLFNNKQQFVNVALIPPVSFATDNNELVKITNSKSKDTIVEVTSDKKIQDIKLEIEYPDRTLVLQYLDHPINLGKEFINKLYVRVNGEMKPVKIENIYLYSINIYLS
jgi:endoglycosylceramidase